MKTIAANDDDPLLDDDAVAALLGVSARTIRLWRRTRGLPHLRITSKVVRHRRADVLSWVERHRVAQVGGVA